MTDAWLADLREIAGGRTARSISTLTGGQITGQTVNEILKGRNRPRRPTLITLLAALLPDDAERRSKVIAEYDQSGALKYQPKASLPAETPQWLAERIGAHRELTTAVADLTTAIYELIAELKAQKNPEP